MAEKQASVAHDRTQHEFWAKLLSDLESNVRSARAALVADGPSPAVWQPPQTPGPIPVELMQRAREVLMSHLDAVEHLEARRNSTLAHLAAVRTVTDVGGTDRAVYLDVAG